MKSSAPRLYVSATGKEYVKMYGKTFKCCRKNIPHPDSWMWIKSVQRWVAPTYY